MYILSWVDRGAGVCFFGIQLEWQKAIVYCTRYSLLFFFSGPRIFSCCKVFLSCHRDLSGGVAVQLSCIIELSTFNLISD